jgi:hypothetical protein
MLLQYSVRVRTFRLPQLRNWDMKPFYWAINFPTFRYEVFFSQSRSNMEPCNISTGAELTLMRDTAVGNV